MKLCLLLLASTALAQNPAKEASLGRSIAAELDRIEGRVDNPSITAYLEKLVARVQKQQMAGPVSFTITVTRDSAKPLVQGLPGGLLRVPLAAILRAGSERALAFALAHGMAHVVARHGLQKASETKGLSTIPVIYLGGWQHGHDERLLPRAMLETYRQQELEADQLAETWVSAFPFASTEAQEFEAIQAAARSRNQLQ
jgi:predicted Zn-dependent protease